jgi:hypothetical protein
MTEHDWLSAVDAGQLWAYARGRALFNRRTAGRRKRQYNQRILYLLGAAVCRRLAHLFPDPCCHRLLEVAEAYAEGAATLGELADAHDEVDGLRCSREVDLLPAGNTAAVEAVVWLSPDDYKVIRALDYVVDAAGYLRAVAAGALPAKAPLRVARAVWRHPAFLRGRGEEELALCLLVRDVIGNPFRPSPPLPRAVLNWDDGTVFKMAEVVYSNRHLPAGTLDPARLTVLADALEDAGCDDAGLLGHLRGPGPHVRGCWALDLLLGKG